VDREKPLPRKLAHRRPICAERQIDGDGQENGDGFPFEIRDVDCYPFIAPFTRAGVIGNCTTRAPTASNTAFATTAPVVMIAGSPPP
jgi:hypothetical protein